MIMTVEELRAYINTDETDDVLAMRLEAIECMIHGYTNNNFTKYRVGESIAYPADVKMGMVNLMKWDMEMREKAGVASETISRHAVSYQTYDGTNTQNGYPANMMGFLKPYRKAQFGQGLIE